jgi:hypothetical protein
LPRSPLNGIVGTHGDASIRRSSSGRERGLRESRPDGGPTNAAHRRRRSRRSDGSRQRQCRHRCDGRRDGAARLRAAISGALHVDVPLVVRSAEDLRAIVRDIPPARVAISPCRPLVAFMPDARRLDRLSEIRTLVTPAERFTLGRNAACLRIPGVSKWVVPPMRYSALTPAGPPAGTGPRSSGSRRFSIAVRPDPAFRRGRSVRR